MPRHGPTLLLPTSLITGVSKSDLIRMEMMGISAPQVAVAGPPPKPDKPLPSFALAARGSRSARATAVNTPERRGGSSQAGGGSMPWRPAGRGRPLTSVRNVSMRGANITWALPDNPPDAAEEGGEASEHVDGAGAGGPGLAHLLQRTLSLKATHSLDIDSAMHSVVGGGGSGGVSPRATPVSKKGHRGGGPSVRSAGRSLSRLPSASQARPHSQMLPARAAEASRGNTPPTGAEEGGPATAGAAAAGPAARPYNFFDLPRFFSTVQVRGRGEGGGEGLHGGRRRGGREVERGCMRRSNMERGGVTGRGEGGGMLERKV